jgi:hypothetical protein
MSITAVPDDVRKGNRAIAAAMVAEEGAEAVAMCRGIAAKAAAEERFEIFDSFTAFADESRKRVDAMKFYATGRTAAGLRAQAADPETVAMIAAGSLETEDEVRAMMLALADGVAQIAADGLTPADCWKLLGWSPDFVRALLASEGGAR